MASVYVFDPGAAGDIPPLCQPPYPEAASAATGPQTGSGEVAGGEGWAGVRRDRIAEGPSLGRQTVLWPSRSGQLRHRPAHAEPDQAADDDLADLVQAASMPVTFDSCISPDETTSAAVIGAWRHIVCTWIR